MPDLGDPAWQRARTDDEIARVIMNGKGSMPGFAEELQPRSIESLVDHVRSFAGAERPEGSAPADGNESAETPADDEASG
jgi:mono/diheme cytochrome c family protein